MYILYLLIAILMFGILIAVHEFGHFITAKLTGVKVNEFSIGMGPQLWKKQKGETLYSLRLFPIGGFCAMEGEDEATGDPRAFTVQPAWKKIVILVAGAFMNFVLGLVLLLIVISQGRFVLTPVVSGLVEGFPNQPGQVLQVGDRITKVDGHVIYLRSDIFLFLSRVEGRSVDLEIDRDGERLVLDDYPLTLVEENGSKRLMLGIVLNDYQEATLGVKLKYAWMESIDNVRLVWYSLGELFRGAVGLQDMSGPVGIISMVGEVGEQGAQSAQANNQPAFLGALNNILSFSAFIAINLAVMNLLPIPALDGGRVLFVLVNGVFTLLTHKKLDPKYEGYVHAAGFVLLIGLMIVVAVSDVWKLIT